MAPQDPEEGLDTVIDQLVETGDREDQVSIANIQEAIDQSSFGPFLLVPAIIEVSPVGAIPGLPTAMAIIVVLCAVQMLFGKQHFWLPKVIRKRSLQGDRLKHALEYVKPVTQWTDKVVRTRFTWATREPFIHIVAGLCILLACMVPPLEAVPFASSAPFATIGLFGLALIARDGLLVLIGLALALGAFYVVYASLVTG
jgi:hypothetical protein